MKTLLERLKPEITIKLKENQAEYGSVVDRILKNLSSKEMYSQLTMSEISTLYTFSDITLLQTSIWDLKYGDNLFIREE